MTSLDSAQVGVGCVSSGFFVPTMFSGLLGFSAPVSIAPAPAAVPVTPAPAVITASAVVHRASACSVICGNRVLVWRSTVADALSVCGRSSHGEHPPLQQLQEQLECFDRLMESPGTRRETADVIMTRSKEVICSMRERASEEDLLDVAEVAWARIATGG